MGILKKMSLINKGLRYRLMIAFSLMAVIPLLACVYAISPYLFPGFQNYVDLNLIVFIAVIISILGLILAKGMVNAVVELSNEAKRIADGDFSRKITLTGDDELGSLGQSINMMTQRIKSNLDELKSYGQSMKEINVEIHKKVLTLSSLLQIGDIISAGSIQLDPLLEMAVEKAATLFDTGFGVLYLGREDGGDFIARTSYNLDREKLTDVVIRREGHGILDKALEEHRILKCDSSEKLSRELDDFRRNNNLKNFLAVPIYSDKSVFGMLIVGNRLSDFKYTTDDVELVNVFAKHITIAIESDILNKRNEELITRDDLTGLFNKRYILSRLEEEIKRAIFYQRPCSFIAFNIDNFTKFRESRGELAAEEALKRIAKIIKDNTSPVGKAARIGGDEFAMLLPEKNKREAAYIAEEVRKKIEAANVLKEGKASLTVSVGVSENPIDGATSDELYKKAMDSIERAKMQGRNRVVA
ncbi:MAG: diguanylate cyclase [Candidatus Omnitrophica bacterium]|nr:diguanylate cyclase [Candidatus Omnitrophota bacterium]MCM8790453.1 diguanylate cyclase [Candidatus Omnitrophota bacterium]